LAKGGGKSAQVSSEQEVKINPEVSQNNARRPEAFCIPQTHPDQRGLTELCQQEQEGFTVIVRHYCHKAHGASYTRWQVCCEQENRLCLCQTRLPRLGIWAGLNTYNNLRPLSPRTLQRVWGLLGTQGQVCCEQENRLCLCQTRLPRLGIWVRLKYIQQPTTLEPSYPATCVGPLRDSRTSVTDRQPELLHSPAFAPVLHLIKDCFF